MHLFLGDIPLLPSFSLSSQQPTLFPGVLVYLKLVHRNGDCHFAGVRGGTGACGDSYLVGLIGDRLEVFFPLVANCSPLIGAAHLRNSFVLAFTRWLVAAQLLSLIVPLPRLSNLLLLTRAFKCKHFIDSFSLPICQDYSTDCRQFRHYPESPLLFSYWHSVFSHTVDFNQHWWLIRSHLQCFRVACVSVLRKRILSLWLQTFSQYFRVFSLTYFIFHFSRESVFKFIILFGYQLMQAILLATHFEDWQTSSVIYGHLGRKARGSRSTASAALTSKLTLASWPLGRICLNVALFASICSLSGYI